MSLNSASGRTSPSSEVVAWVNLHERAPAPLHQVSLQFSLLPRSSNFNENTVLHHIISFAVTILQRCNSRKMRRPVINALRNGAAYGSLVPAWKRSLHLAPPFLLDDYMPRVCDPHYCYSSAGVLTNDTPVHDLVLGRCCEEAVEGVWTFTELQPVPSAMRCESIREDRNVSYWNRRRGQRYCPSFW